MKKRTFFLSQVLLYNFKHFRVKKGFIHSVLFQLAFFFWLGDYVYFYFFIYSKKYIVIIININNLIKKTVYSIINQNKKKLNLVLLLFL